MMTGADPLLEALSRVSNSSAAADSALAAALEREHHEIDAGVEAFLAARTEGGEEAQPLARAIAALRRHIYLEEEFLFPPLSEAGLSVPIFVMLREHGEIWDTMDTIEQRLDEAPARNLDEELCRQLLSQTERHNSKEEAIIYPQVASASLSAADSGLRQFIAGGQMPQGWICRRASRSPLRG